MNDKTLSCPKCERVGKDCGEHTPSWGELACYWKDKAEAQATRIEALEAELGNEKAHYETAQANWDLCLDRIEALEAALRDVFIHGHGEGWRGNQMRRDVKRVDAEKSWSLYVSSGALGKTIALLQEESVAMSKDDVAGLAERLRERADLPSTFDFVGNRVEGLFDQENRHRSGAKPIDYLRSWLSMLRPFAYATKDDSWGEMEKLLCIVMRNYIEMSRESGQAAVALTTLSARVETLEAALREIDRMNDHPKWFRIEMDRIVQSALAGDTNHG